MSLITYETIAARYSELARALDATVVNSVHIPFAQAELEGKLGVGFTVPFSSNNLTAQDLCVDLVYARVYQFSAPDKVEKVREHIEARCMALLSGREDMKLIDGTLVHSTAVASAMWSRLGSYHPTFGMDEPEDQCIDKDRVQADYDARD